MKYLLFILLSPLICLSQLDYSKNIICDYVEFERWRYDLSDYIYLGGGELQYIFSPEQDFYTIQFDNQEQTKVLWSFEGKSADGAHMYFCEEASSAIYIDKKQQRITVFYSYNDITEKYDQVMILSQLSFVDKKNNTVFPGEYVPQTQRK